ncbi:MAG TPA: hypothetical protein VKB38_13240 [Terracidiphilus sp.]|nr:hypothetical protein [Terracidiphilus sp.]
MNDHDLLIQIATKLDRAILDIKELKDNTTTRVAALEQEKANQADLEEFKVIVDKRFDAQGKKLDKVYSWMLMGLGALGIIEFAIQIYTNYFQK